jgi:spermidine synthase
MTDILDRIQNYLGSGGLFNPELMEHDKVRDLIRDCREEITQLREIAFDIAMMDSNDYTEHDEALFEDAKSLADKWFENKQQL